MVSTTPACNRCRARKVRCDRRLGQCGPCARLSAACFYPEPRDTGAHTASAVIASAPPGSLYSRFRLQPEHKHGCEPDADTDDAEPWHKRPRAPQACVVCREHKIKCVGGDPCSRCRSSGTRCAWTSRRREEQTQRDRILDVQPSPMSMDGQESSFVGSASTPGDHPSPSSSASGLGLRSTSSASEYDQLDSTTIRRCIDAHFGGNTHGFMFPILLKSLVLADWKSGALHPLLLKCIVAFGICLHDDTAPDADDAKLPASASGHIWMDEVRSAVLQHVGQRPSLAVVQVMVLLLRYWLVSGRELMAMWNMISLGARFAFSLALNHERDSDAAGACDTTTQEMRRRAMWALYMIDCLLCGGIDDLSVCPLERIRVRLPCSEQSFLRGIPSAAPFEAIEGSQAAHDQHGEDVDMLAAFLRLLGHRHRILRYTKRIRKENVNPEMFKDKVAALQQDLVDFARTLPACLRHTTQNMVLVAHSADADWYLSLHTLLFQCHCDLFRHVIPGLREALGPEALRDCPAYATACQKACLDAAINLCGLWADAQRFDFPRVSDATFLVACVYQAARIILHLRSLLAEGDSHSRRQPRQADEVGQIHTGGDNVNYSNGGRGPSQSPTPTAAFLAGNLQAALDLLDNSRRIVPTARSFIRDVKGIIGLLTQSNTNAVPVLQEHEKPPSGEPYLSSKHSFIEKVSSDVPISQEAESGDRQGGVDGGFAASQTQSTSLAPLPGGPLRTALDASAMPEARRGIEGVQDEEILHGSFSWGLDDYCDLILGVDGADLMQNAYT